MSFVPFYSGFDRWTKWLSQIENNFEGNWWIFWIIWKRMMVFFCYLNRARIEIEFWNIIKQSHLNSKRTFQNDWQSNGDIEEKPWRGISYSEWCTENDLCLHITCSRTPINKMLSFNYKRHRWLPNDELFFYGGDDWSLPLRRNIVICLIANPNCAVELTVISLFAWSFSNGARGGGAGHIAPQPIFLMSNWHRYNYPYRR